MPESFPTAELVARAIVGASRRTGAIPLGVPGAFRLEEKRARLYAFAALLELCPDVAAPAIGRAVGATRYRACHIRGEVNTARSASLWWVESIVAETVAEIHAHYESAAPVTIDPPPLPVMRKPEAVKSAVSAIVAGKPAPKSLKTAVTAVFGPPPALSSARVSAVNPA
jgi:hypothetical protein